MYTVLFIYSNLSLYCFPFLSFQGEFFSLQEQWPFFTVITVGDCLFHQAYWFPYRPRVWPLILIAVTIGNSIPSFYIFTIWRVAGLKWSMRRPPQIIMQNGPPFIINRSSPGGVSRRGVFHKCFDIYTPPPQNRPRSGSAKQILPLTGDAVTLALMHAQLIPDWGVGVGGVYLECVLCDTGTVTSHRKWLCILHAEHPWRAPHQKKTVISQYVLAWFLCQYKPYGTIILTTM